MFSQQTNQELEDNFGYLTIATCVLERNEDAEWKIFWQNKSAASLWGNYEIDEDFELKLALMDAMTRVGASSFQLEVENCIDPLRFTVSPENDKVLLQFVPERQPEVVSYDRRKDDLYKLVVEGTRLGVFDWNIHNDNISFSDRIYEICHITPSDLGSSRANLIERIHPDDLSKVNDALDVHLENRWPFEVEFRIRSSVDTYTWILARGKAVWDAVTGQAVRFVGMMVNISERKNAQEQVSQKELLIEQIIDSLPVSIYVKDDRGCFRFFSKQTEMDTGISRDEAIGRTDYEVFPIDIARKQVMGDQVAKEENRLVMTEDEMKISGASRWLMMGKGPINIVNKGEERTWILGFSIDITQRKTMEEMLRLAKEEAEAATKAKSEFLSVMSHEIRTPLNSVIGTSALLLDMGLSKEELEHAEMIKRSGEHLLHLINDILDFNKLEAGRMELESRPLNLAVQAETSVGITAANAKLKGLPVVLDYDDSIGLFFKGDESRLRQILLNLLGNAVKFTEKGQVTLRITEKENESGQCLVRFEVVDTGIGIPADKIDALFSEFTQVDASTSRKFGGTGLGLSICKKLVEAMKGEIGILSELGQGSTFWFEVPLPKISETEAQAVLAEDLPELTRSLNILVAEDNLPNQMLIKAILTKLGHQIVLANNGVKAVEAMISGEQHFDLILMDMQMPEMDGLEATKQIRTLKSEGSQIPIIALTANALAGDRERVMDAGMNDYLTKPIDIKALKRALKIWGNSVNE